MDNFDLPKFLIENGLPKDYIKDYENSQLPKDKSLGFLEETCVKEDCFKENFNGYF